MHRSNGPNVNSSIYLPFFLQFTHLTDRQTDGQTPFSSLVRAGIPCSTKIKPTVYMVTQNHWL